MTLSYFEEIEKQIISNISSSQSSVFVAVAWFTNQLLFDSLTDAIKNNVAVKVLILDDILNRNEFGLDFGVLSKLGADVRFANPTVELCITNSVSSTTWLLPARIIGHTMPVETMRIFL